jgi:hypothetical protein
MYKITELLRKPHTVRHRPLCHKYTNDTILNYCIYVNYYLKRFNIFQNMEKLPKFDLPSAFKHVFVYCC